MSSNATASLASNAPDRSGPLPRTIVSWSSGKDSAYALYELRRQGTHDLAGLLTTITEPFARVSMHGVREEVLEMQARAVDLPLYKVGIPFPCPNSVYEERMGAMVRRLREEGVERIVFGDLYLEDIRRYREDRLRGTGITPEFPLWGRPTLALAERMIDEGLRATLVAIDPRKLPGTFAGRTFDRALLADLPAGVDPCGENGEFHTCVTAGPMFSGRLPVRTGPVTTRDGYVFADVIPQ
ncbi:MAG: ATP-binding protein [Thermoplasmata archaeon]